MTDPDRRLDLSAIDRMRDIAMAHAPLMLSRLEVEVIKEALENAIIERAVNFDMATALIAKIDSALARHFPET